MQYRYQILWIADFVGFIFTDAWVTNSTVSVIMNATLSGKGVLLSSLTRVAPIIGSVIGIGRYWDISTVSVIGISIVLLTDYASMTS